MMRCPPVRVAVIVIKHFADTIFELQRDFSLLGMEIGVSGEPDGFSDGNAPG